MIRKIIQIDESKCTGCRLCVDACHEGAIGMVDGKARLLKDSYCDGLGDCLPACPTGAITFVEREADPYDEVAVQVPLATRKGAESPNRGCPSARPHAIERPAHSGCPSARSRAIEPAGKTENAAVATHCPSELRNWPVQIKLAPIAAPYFNGAHLLVAADCAAFTYGNFHADFIRDRVVLIGCPKLDGVDYTEKLSAILAQNDIESVTVARMEVPCCGGIEAAARNAVSLSGKNIPCEVRTISIAGELL